MNQLSLQVLEDRYAIVQLQPDSKIPDWVLTGTFFSVTRTPEELSLVCEETAVPKGIIAEPGWRALKIEGVLDFGLVGILAEISRVLAEAGVSIFALSTYNTDYILVKEEKMAEAITSLIAAGYFLVKGSV